MSRVRLIDIYNERFNEPTLKLSATADVEVVPRKIVEMIIERCSIGEKLVNKTTAMEVRDIRNYAESLLKQFEEEDEEDELDFEITAEDLHDYMYGI